MRAVLQRVTRASVEVEGRVVGRDRPGWLVLLGVARGDTDDDAAWLAEKVAEPPGLRGRPGQDEPERGRTSGGGILVVSQFTLLGDCRAGRRPSFTEAAEPGRGRAALPPSPTCLAASGPGGRHRRLPRDDEGRAGQRRPVTLLLDSRKAF